MPKLILETNPESFFYELVRNAVEHQKVTLQPETEFYLVKLLIRFIFSESLYLKNSEGELHEQPLVFLYKEALEANETPTQKALFQNVGDISLYKSGFFQESLNRAHIDLDYYMNMGALAYQNAAERTDGKHFKYLFTELSEKFGRFVDVLLEISEKTTSTKTEQDLLRLYEMWSQTGSERAARALTRAGIQLKKDSKNE